MRVYRMFLIPFIAATCLCSSVFAATSQRVLSAAISAANTTDTGVQNRTTTTRGKNTSTSTTVSRTATAPGVKSRAATSENSKPVRKSDVSRTATTRVAPATTQTARNAVVARAPTKSVSNRNANATRPTVSARAASNATTAPNAAMQSILDAEDANKKCLESYTQCMDNYCNVLDADLGRCSCSGDITQFSKISDTLAATNVELQDVMKKISYIGLSADEITTMYTQTAAEGVMGTVQDTSQTKSDLEAIKGMLVDIKSQSNTSVTNSNDISGLLNLNLDLTQGNNFDASSILGSIGAKNSSPLNNQRGEQLYKSAAARCKSSVLKNCIDAEPDIVESRYQTEINRACTTYSKALQEKNDAARRMLDNAYRVLQTARLKVQSDKDSYDMRACVAALDTCMRDEFVCGDNYEYCLDSTGRYFVSGELVSGKSESEIMTGIWGVSEPGNDSNFIKSNTSKGNVANLIAKIGNPIRGNGLCSSVLNKCQSQWRNGKSDSYDTMNKVVLAYLGGAIPKIVARQRELINDFRGDCVSAVNACMAKQGLPTGVKPRANQDVIGDFLAAQVGACRTTIDMCAGVTNMTTEQLLAGYIQKNVCDTYSDTSDTCETAVVENPVEPDPPVIEEPPVIVADNFTITTTEMEVGTEFKFTMSAAGTFTVDWGDGNVDEIIRNDTQKASYSHTYKTSGTHTIKFGGAATRYNGAYIPDPAISFAGNTNIFATSGSLGAIFPGLGGSNRPIFSGAFNDCTGLTSISSDLFSGVSAKPYLFYSTFKGCSNLKNIPPDLFSGVTGAAKYMFFRTFDGCTRLTEIPKELFSNVSGAAEYMFSNTFQGCRGLTGEIPRELFKKVSGAAKSMFSCTFCVCTSLTSIPDGLFSGVSGAAESMFSSTFLGCTELTDPIPVGFFGNISGAPATGMFRQTFNGCKNLTGPTALMPDGKTELYNIVNPATGKTWWDESPGTFNMMYDDTQITGVR